MPPKRARPATPPPADPFGIDLDAGRPAWLDAMDPATRRVYYLVHRAWADDPKPESRTTETLGSPTEYFEAYGPPGDTESEEVTHDEFVQALFACVRDGLRARIDPA